jgi:hypothetical protein
VVVRRLFAKVRPGRENADECSFSWGLLFAALFADSRAKTNELCGVLIRHSSLCELSF